MLQNYMARSGKKAQASPVVIVIRNIAALPPRWLI
jgi:hypothetical protein